MFNFENENDVPNVSTPPQKRKRTWLKILIISVLALVIISGATVLGYYTFLPAKYVLMAAGYASTTKSYDLVDKSLTQYENYNQTLLNTTIQKETKMGLSLDKSFIEQFTPGDEADDIIKAINNTSLKYDFAVDYKNKKFTTSIGLNFLLNPILTARFSFDDTKFSMGVDELTNKTLTGDIKKLSTLSRFSPETPTERLEALEKIDPWASSKLVEEIKFDRRDIKNLMFNYSKVVMDSISDDDMSIKRGVSTDVLDKTVKCQEITLKLDTESQKKIALNILEMLKTDDSFYNLTLANLDTYFKILGESSYMGESLEEFDFRDNLSKEKYLEFLSLMEKEIEQLENMGVLEMKLYVDGLDIVKYIVSYEDTSSVADDTVLIVEQRINGQSFDYKLTIGTEIDGEIYNSVMSIKRDYDDAKDLNDIFFKLDLLGNSKDQLKASISFESDEESKGKDEIKHTIVCNTDFEQPTTNEKVSIKLTLDGDKLRNSKNLVTESDYKGKLSISVPSEDFDFSEFGFYVKTETVYGEEIIIPEPDEIIDIETATEEDFIKLYEEVYSRIGSLSQLMGAF